MSWPNDKLTPMLEKYPRIWLHESIDGRGAPLVVNGSLNRVMLEQIARFSIWSVSPIDVYDGHREVFARLRALNPEIKILAHVLAPCIWPASGTGWSGRLYQAIAGRFCAAPGGVWENYARLDLPEVQDAITRACIELMDSGCFDGLFLERFTADDSWMWYTNPTLDLEPWRTNPTQTREQVCAMWAGAMRQGKRLIATILRAKYPHAILVGNGGSRGPSPVFNGWCRENWPQQNGGTWDSNISNPSWGLISDDAFYSAQPALSPICLARDVVDEAGMRYALGSSCLGGGALIVGPSDFRSTIPYASWWLDDYARDRSSWAPMAVANGYLGVPLGPACQTAPGVWHRAFKYGQVTVDTFHRTARFER
jgi:hypothetical protein